MISLYHESVYCRSIRDGNGTAGANGEGSRDDGVWV